MPLVAAIALIVTAVLFVVGIITLIVGFATHRVSMESPLADDDDNDDLSDDTATLLSMLPGASVVVDEHDEVVAGRAIVLDVRVSEHRDGCLAGEVGAEDGVAVDRAPLQQEHLTRRGGERLADRR